MLSPSSFVKAGIDKWTTPAGAKFSDYAATQHVYELTGGANDAAPYVEKIIEQILA